MEAALQGIVEGIHASGRRCVLAIMGGGSGAIAALLRVPGGSRVLLEAIVPYERGALVELLGREPEQACSAETAVAMARRALARGRRRSDEPRLVGVGVTASLGSDRPKGGDHRCHIAVAGAVAFELAVLNADKPPLRAAEVRHRLAQFAWRQTVELTRAATFREKAHLLPGVTFVVGADTAERIVQPRYYGDRTGDMLAALDEIARHGCRFLVAGRTDDQGRFVTLASIVLPARFAGPLEQNPKERFRRDVSSSGLRQRPS